jgi:colanic acid/amylovoran biosynthesis glycosyltransferase
MRNPTVLHSSPIWLQQTQTWIYNQVAELQRLGVKTHVVCEYVENLEQFRVANIHCFSDEAKRRQLLDKGLRKLRIRRHLNYLVSVGRKVDAQILHSHFGHVAWANLSAARQLKAKHVVTFYGLDVNMLPTQSPTWRQRYNELFEEADLILCEGSHMANCIVLLGCPPKKIKVQHLGVDVENIKFSPRQWGSGEPLKVLIAASFREKKGISYAIEALGLLHKAIPLKLTIIGDAGADPASQREKKAILDALERSGLSEDACLLGYQSHETLFHEAYQHHIFLSPSVTASDGDTEGGAPVALIEMAASGMPIVSTTHCDIPEIVKHGVTGLLAAERDVDALVCHLKWFVENPEKWGDMLEAGRRHVEHEYDLHTQGGRLAIHYSALVA